MSHASAGPKYSTISASRWLLNDILSCCFLRPDGRKGDGKGGAGARPGLEPDIATPTRDDAVHHREPKAGATGGPFGGEKRLEGTDAHAVAHARAVIREFEHGAAV